MFILSYDSNNEVYSLAMSLNGKYLVGDGDTIREAIENSYKDEYPYTTVLTGNSKDLPDLEKTHPELFI